MRRQAATPITILAPFGGMNTRDAVSALPQGKARLLENFVCKQGSVYRRPGYVQHSISGPAASVGTLHAHYGPAGQALIGVAGGNVYDYSGSTASSLSVAGYSSDFWQAATFNGYSIFVNGNDTPFRFDGASVSATGFTGPGLTLSSLINVTVSRNRLWFCQRDSADVWYGGISSITGGLTKFQLSQLTGGGHCVAVMPWSVEDAGDGADDYTVFLMSTGEVVVYSGDPAATFSLIGKYQMPRPIGFRCWAHLSGEPIIITEAGLIPLKSAVRGVAFQDVALGLFGEVGPSLAADARTYGNNNGWQIAFVDGLFYINVPTTSGTSKQWVLNTQIGAWSYYSGLPALSIVEYNGELYLGHPKNGGVYRHSSNVDDGATIICRARTGFVAATNGNIYNATAVLHYLEAIGAVTGRFALDFDFNEKPLSSTARVISDSTSTTPWGALWGSPWSSTRKTQTKRFSAHGAGQFVAVALELSGSATEVKWQSSQILGTQGNF